MSETAFDQIKPSDLPSPPQTALQILRACSSDEVSSNELSALAEKDPVLTAELLRLVNTPLFGMSRKVQSLTHAVTILGHRALRNIVLCFTVRDVINRHTIPGFDIAPHWEDSLRRAVSAKLLATRVGANTDECFTAGLLQDFGLLVMFYMMPEKAEAWTTLRRLNPSERMRQEEEIFATSHTKTAALLSDAWSLPEELGDALGAHHCCEDSGFAAPIMTLCRILYCADWMTAMYTADNKNQVLMQNQQLLNQYFGLEEETVTECLSTLSMEVEAAAASLGLHISRQPDFEQLMLQANVKLAEANLSYQELTWKLEQTLKERDQLAEELDNELTLAREIQESLLPSNLSADFPVTGINVSARHLSGDFYDYFQLRDGRIYFNLADVSGKGVNAALLMVKTSSLFHCLGKHIHEPDKLLTHINNELCETAIRGMFVTMIAGIYDPQTGKVQMVNAGNPPALLVGADGKTEVIEATNVPLGILPNSTFELSEQITLGADALYLFSDGATESRLDNGKMLGVFGLLDMILEHRDKSAKSRLEAIVEQFQVTSDKLHDDITILLIEDPKAHAPA